MVAYVSRFRSRLTLLFDRYGVVGLENAKEVVMFKSKREATVLVAAILLTMTLTGCGGGGGVGSGLPRPVDPTRDFPLPSGHGLGAGVITVAAGASAEHGNVVITCRGSSACVVTVSVHGIAVYDTTGGIPSVMAAYDSWGLPSGHGLRPGVITVAAGTAEEHGNVVVTCPPGGSACMVRVSADGAAEYARTGGVPTFTFSHLASEPTYERNNPTAEDLLDHWNEPEPLRAALGLSAVAAEDIAGRKNALVDLINAAGGNSAETGTRLRNVAPEDIEIIGERGGITYGRWRGGPAGTMNIEFDWRFGQNFNAETRARMDRAGKSWSWRILYDNEPHVLREGGEIAGGLRVLDEDVVADDVRIFVIDRGDNRPGLASGGPSWWRYAEDDGRFQPIAGYLYYGPLLHDRTAIMAHEIGHVMNYVSGDRRRWMNRDNGTFEGPESMRVNGGQPLPYQRVGGQVQYTHLGHCGSIMAYCSDPREVFRPSDIDFAYFSDAGYNILDAETASEPELYGYGAWGQYSAWGAGVERTIEYEGGSIVSADDRLRASADAFGMAPSADLAEAHAPMQGGITWSGSLIGVDLGQAMLPPVFGNAELQVELSTLQGTATFENLTVHIDGESSAFRSRRLEYAIGVAGNNFSGEDGRVVGGFFGPGHQEMAGVLDDRRATVSLLAGFGGTR